MSHQTEAQPASSPARAKYLVSAQWLQENIQSVRDGHVILLETGAVNEAGVFRNTLGEYAQGHIPGAVYADLVFAFSDAGSAQSFRRPTELQFRNAVSQLGISNQSTVIIYDRGLNEWASRLLWVFKAWGHDDVRVLDGGLKKWESDGGELEVGVNQRDPLAPDGYETDASAEYFVDSDDVLAAVGDPDHFDIVTSLPEAFLAEGTGVFARPGRIPGSRIFPLKQIVAEDNTLLPVPVGADSENKVKGIAYCGSGILSALYAVSQSASGAKPVAVYDGSLEEWASDESLPLETER